MSEKMESALAETEDRLKMYMKNEDTTKELREMCKNCEGYCGKDHDYTECRDKPCFLFWLAYKHLEWILGYE